jgi:hypothetical protein
MHASESEKGRTGDADGPRHDASHVGSKAVFARNRESRAREGRVGRVARVRRRDERLHARFDGVKRLRAAGAQDASANAGNCVRRPLWHSLPKGWVPVDHAS